MTTVTLDVDDVEALLFSVNALQGVENALAAKQRDPMVASAKGRLSAAHDRIASEWRRAKRPETEAPGENDLFALHSLFIDTDDQHLTTAMLNHYPRRLAQDLQLVESGPCWEGMKIDWPAPSTPEFRMGTTEIRYAARLTPRGDAALEAFRRTLK